MIGRFEIRNLFNIYDFKEVNRSANTIRVLGKRYNDYIVLKIDLNENQTVKAINANYFDNFSDATEYFKNLF